MHFHSPTQVSRIVMTRAIVFLLLSLFSDLAIANESIVLGQTAALTGQQGAHGAAIRDGALAFFRTTNQRGGLQKRRIELITLDDQGKPELARENAERLAADPRVLAFFGITSRTAVEISIPIAQRTGMAVVGSATGASAIHETPLKGVLNTRSGYRTELMQAVKLLKAIGFRDFAFVYMEDDRTKSNLALMQAAADSNGVRLVGATSLRRDSNDVASALSDIEKMRPQIVVGVAAPKQYALLIRAARSSKSAVLFGSSSFAGETLASELGADGRGTIISQIAPLPQNNRQQSRLMLEFKRDFKDAFPGRTPSIAAVEGYIAARTFVDLIKQSRTKITRQSIVTSVEDFSALDLEGYRVARDPQRRTGSDYVELTIIGRDGRLTY
jgi:branched-chain amino acid transport system substrate-binding protein